jgi:hypothetical protein
MCAVQKDITRSAIVSSLYHVRLIHANAEDRHLGKKPRPPSTAIDDERCLSLNSLALCERSIVAVRFRLAGFRCPRLPRRVSEIWEREDVMSFSRLRRQETCWAQQCIEARATVECTCMLAIYTRHRRAASGIGYAVDAPL